jgi:2-polyprenyl-6-methoxyphenol hydroxylase-like FAD-dependent oxidoreductase
MPKQLRQSSACFAKLPIDMPNAMQDVLVVGAGPVGLTMAAELARHGASCRIVDQLAVPLPYCRAIGITPRTLEVWDDMGIVQSMIDAGLWLRATRSILNGGPPQDSVVDLPISPSDTWEFVNRKPSAS